MYFTRALLFSTILSFILGTSLHNRVEKKLDKHYKGVTLLGNVVRETSEGKIYSIVGKEDRVYVAKASSRFEDFDYMLILDPNNVIISAHILIYREDYGGEIASRSYLRRNYIGKSDTQYMVDGISGATISVNSLRHSINTLYSEIREE